MESLALTLATVRELLMPECFLIRNVTACTTQNEASVEEIAVH